MALSLRRSSQGRAQHQRRAWWEVWELLKDQQVRKKLWPPETRRLFKHKSDFLISQCTIQTQALVTTSGGDFWTRTARAPLKVRRSSPNSSWVSSLAILREICLLRCKIALFKNLRFCLQFITFTVHWLIQASKNLQVKRDSGPNKQWARASRDCPISSAEGLHSHQTGWLFLFQYCLHFHEAGWLLFCLLCASECALCKYYYVQILPKSLNALTFVVCSTFLFAVFFFVCLSDRFLSFSIWSHPIKMQLHLQLNQFCPRGEVQLLTLISLCNLPSSE